MINGFIWFLEAKRVGGEIVITLNPQNQDGHHSDRDMRGSFLIR